MSWNQNKDLLIPEYPKLRVRCVQKNADISKTNWAIVSPEKRILTICDGIVSWGIGGSGNVEQASAARLMALAFHGKPRKKDQRAHRKGTLYNPMTIRWATHNYNKWSVPENTRREIYDLYWHEDSEITQMDISRMYKIHRSVVNRIVNKKPSEL